MSGRGRLVCQGEGGMCERGFHVRGGGGSMLEGEGGHMCQGGGGLCVRGEVCVKWGSMLEGERGPCWRGRGTCV